MNGVDNKADLGGVLARREYDAPHPPPTERMPAVVPKESRLENYRRLGASYTSEPIGTSQKRYQEKNEIAEIAKYLSKT